MTPNKIQIIDQFLNGLRDELMTIPEMHVGGVLCHHIQKVCAEKCADIARNYYKTNKDDELDDTLNGRR